MPSKIPVIPRSTIEPPLSTTALPAQDVPALLRNEESIALETRSAPLVFLQEFAQTKCGGAFNIASLADLFKLARSRVHTVRVTAANKSRAPHRPIALSNEQESELCLMTREKSIARNYVTKRELLNSIQEYFRVSVTYGWILCYLVFRSDCSLAARVKGTPLYVTTGQNGFGDLMSRRLKLQANNEIYGLTTIACCTNCEFPKIY
jgi:hypothetical protein